MSMQLIYQALWDSTWVLFCCEPLVTKKVIGKFVIVLSLLNFRVRSFKTQCMSLKNQCYCLSESFIKDGYNIKVKNSVTLKSAVVDSKSRFSKFSFVVCASCFALLSCFSSNRKRLSREITKPKILILVTNSFNNFNSIFHGLPECKSTKLRTFHHNEAIKLTFSPVIPFWIQLSFMH